MKCPRHPKYKGSKKPSNTCGDCLRVYMALGKMERKPTPPPTKVHKDKKKYSRKSIKKAL